MQEFVPTVGLSAVPMNGIRRAEKGVLHIRHKLPSKHPKIKPKIKILEMQGMHRRIEESPLSPKSTLFWYEGYSPAHAIFYISPQNLRGTGRWASFILNIHNNVQNNTRVNRENWQGPTMFPLLNPIHAEEQDAFLVFV